MKERATLDTCFFKQPIHSFHLVSKKSLRGTAERGPVRIDVLFRKEANHCRDDDASCLQLTLRRLQIGEEEGQGDFRSRGLART